MTDSIPANVTTISYEELVDKLARICFEDTFRHHTLIGLNNSTEYGHALYDNSQLLGSVIYALFPELYDEGEFWHAVREAELEGVLVQVSRRSEGQISSAILSDPAEPRLKKELLHRDEPYTMKHKIEVSDDPLM